MLPASFTRIAMSDPVELLFFDTFAHENSEELNLDLVQFPKPVYVTEVRIIPLGARVHADFPGGVRLGATNPSQFQIEFFVNDLGKPGLSTFESLGGFEYNQNGCINLECASSETVRKIPTDGLVLRGWYTTITLAVYGTLTANIAEQIIQPAVTPSLPAQPNTIADVQQIISTNAIENDWPQETIQPIEYAQQPATASYSQNYSQPAPYSQEYNDFYPEVPKDPRSYHHTPETDWEHKSRGRSIEIERERDRDRDRARDIGYQKTGSSERDYSRDSDRRERDRDRDRGYSRSHSQDRHNSRDRDYDRDWDHDRPDYRDRDREWERERDKDRDRSYKHYDRRTYGREDREERKRPRTPPVQYSSKRPHTPHTEHKEPSPHVPEPVVEDSNSERQRKEKEVIPDSVPADEVKEPRSPVHEENTQQMDVEEFEPILSDEDILDDNEHYQEVDYDYSAYTNNDDIIKLFVPAVTELQKHPKKNTFEVVNNKLHLCESLRTTIGIADDFFKSSITKYTLENFEKYNTEIKEEFVHLCEKTPTMLGEIEQFCDIVRLYKCLKNIESNEFSESDKEIYLQVQNITETLVEWLKVASNYEMANVQDQPGYKIRHIKCGVRLAEWCCNSIDFVHILWEQNFIIHDVLLHLYEQEFMALSIKLMILRALDTYLLKRPAIECFLLGEKKTHSKENGFFDNIPFSEHNGYKVIVELIRKNPSVRLKFALNSILRKLNFFEVLHKLQGVLVKMRTVNEKKSGLCDTTLIVNSLDQILHMIQNGAFVVSQPKRFLPVAAQFEINRNESRNILVDFLEMHNMLQCFLLLFTLPQTMNLPSVKTPILQIFSELLTDMESLQYLSRNSETVNLLLKCLLQTEEEITYLQDSMEARSHNLGLQIAYMLQSLYHVERLLDFKENFKYDCNTAEVIDELHALYCLTFSVVGKFACARVLGMNDNIRCLLQFVDTSVSKDKSDAQIHKLKKSPAMGYIADLIGFTISCTPNIPFLENYAKILQNLVNQKDHFEASVTDKLSEIQQYLKPIENINVLNYDNISPFVEIINRSLDSVMNCPGQLITALRIIEYLGISNHSNKTPVLSENPLSNYIELKYKHVILQLFSLDGVSLLTKVLQKICDYYEQPGLHSSTFCSSYSISILNVIEPAVALLKQMLTYVIHCRNIHFKDLTSIPVLLQTYNLLRAFPINSPVYSKARNVCESIIETLLVYTQPVSDEIHEKDSLNKTLWTLMCGEVIKYITTAPYTFISGLLIFSELLPLPLPIQAKEDLTKEEVSWAINLRKLWSAHLHAHSSSIQEFINRMCITSHQPLLNLLRRVCVQLSDLAANTAITIARGVLDTVLNALNVGEEKLEPCTGNIARLLNFLACLVTHSPLKCAVLQLIQNNASSLKSDEKYPALINVFAQILKLNDTSNHHIQAQECILSIFQSFCDSEITLFQSIDSQSPLSSDLYLANALPIKEQLVALINIMLDHMMVDNSFVTYLPIVRSLLLLTEHNYGFYHLRECLHRRNEPFLNILNKFKEHFSKDNAECVSTLNTLIEFLRLCAAPEEVEGPLLYTPRNMKMSVAEISAVIGWKAEENEETRHPLYLLEDLLKNVVKEDQTFDSLLEALTSLVKLLNGASSPAKENYAEPVLPAPESLLIQFSGRQVYTSSGLDDNRLTSAYWLSAPSEESEGEPENVVCDLAEIYKLHLSQEMNLIREVEKLCRICPSDSSEQNNSKEKRSDPQKEKMKRPFVTPIRGRGFPRTVPQRADLFRSRPPNTSRPPSLHVDDFVALETCGAQPTGPTGYNKISRELLATSRVARGTRGRAFVHSERAMQYRMSWWSAGISRSPYQ